MADKANFVEQEWALLLQSPMLAGMAVSAAEPSGLWGLLKESFAAGGALLDVRRDPSAPSLLRTLADELSTAEGRSLAQASVKERFAGRDPQALKAAALEGLGAVGRLLDAKAPAEAAAIKAWLVATGERVASASREGGFLGIGGVTVSEAEARALDAIRAALGSAVA